MARRADPTPGHQRLLGLAAVAGLSVATALAFGRVFTGRQAKELKLVDELGGFDEAVAAAAKMAGMKDDPPELEYPRKDKKLLEELLGEDARSMVGGAASSMLEGLGGGMGLQYRMPIVEGQ